MNCKKCGFQNAADSKFCRSCGAHLEAENAVPDAPEAPLPPPQAVPPPYQPAPPHQPAPYPPQQMPLQPYQKPKSKTGLIIGLILGILVLLAAAAAAVYFFVLGPPQGEWYNAERGWVLSIGSGNSIEKFSLEGLEKATYEYENLKSQGIMTLDTKSYLFKTDSGRLLLGDEGETISFIKLEEKESIEKYVLKALEGNWASEELGEVLQFENGSVYVYSHAGDFKGGFEYNIIRGEGTLTLHSKDYTIRATHAQLEVKDVGVYTKADKGLDIKAFLAQTQSPVLGMWYESQGELGTILFSEDGTLQVEMMGQIYFGTYTFDAASGTGAVTVEGETTPFTVSGGLLQIEEYTYMRDYIPQQTAPENPTGTWYEATGKYGTITLYDDGGVEWYENGETYYGRYTYNPAQALGEITVNFGYEADVTFTYDGSALYVGEDIMYTRNYVEEVIHVFGAWFDNAAQAGTIYFYEDGTYYMDTYGLQISNTFSFDPASRSGTLTKNFDGENFVCNFYLDGNYLNIEGTLYTRRYVEQPYYAEPVAG